MMLKFKTGDWVIAPSARIPTWRQITVIDNDNQRYIVSSGGCLYFEFQHEWVKLEEMQDVNYIILFINQELDS